ncbi:MAG: hypothetical protein ACO1RX_19195 [Candidatus Sericytochromatia bacterium]
MTFPFRAWIALVALSACAPTPYAPSSTHSALRSQSSSPSLQSRFVQAADLPAPALARWTAQVQTYADEISRKRELDFFQVFPQPLGLQLQVGSEQAWVLSYLGSARTRNDLNVELRLLSARNSGLNLNYSGPVTLSRSSENPAPLVQAAGEGLELELITGLPGNGVVERYSEYMDGLGDYLRYRFQSQPLAWDDAPLVYALNQNGEPQAFVFCNQRNRLVLGERKYADVQSVVVVSPQQGVQGSYTIIGFNPKTPAVGAPPRYSIENHPDFGPLAVAGL